MLCEKIFVGDATQHWKKVFHPSTRELLSSTFCRSHWLLHHYYFLEHPTVHVVKRRRGPLHMGQSVTLRGRRFWLKPLSFKKSFLISFTEITKAELFKTIKNTIPSPTDENVSDSVTVFSYQRSPYLFHFTFNSICQPGK